MKRFSSRLKRKKAREEKGAITILRLLIRGIKFLDASLIFAVRTSNFFFL